jgi:hypothetical protein
MKSSDTALQLTTGAILTEPDRRGELYALYLSHKKAQRDQNAMFDAAFLESIDNYGEFELPGPDGERKRVYAGKRKSTKCNDPAATLDAILSAVGGDVATVASFMSANAWKPGACREPLDGKWSDHFTVEESKDLKTGKAKKPVLMLADDRYTAR